MCVEGGAVFDPLVAAMKLETGRGRFIQRGGGAKTSFASIQPIPVTYRAIQECLLFYFGVSLTHLAI